MSASPGRQHPTGTPVGRRVVLGMLGLGAVGVLTGRTLQSGADRVSAWIGTAGDSAGLGDLLPGAGGFRYYSVTGSVPAPSPTEYRLRVDGLVARARTYDLAALHTLPQVTLTRDFQCVTGWRVPGVTWSGVRLRDLLDAAGVGPRAAAVRFGSFDGAYTESLTLEQARRDDVLVAHTMSEGSGSRPAPIRHEHGGPVRLFVAPMYGYKSAKWLQRIEVVDKVVPGFWEQRGYDVDAWVGRSNGRDDAPTA